MPQPESATDYTDYTDCRRAEGPEILATDYTDYTDCRRAEEPEILPRITPISQIARRRKAGDSATDYTDFTDCRRAEGERRRDLPWEHVGILPRNRQSVPKKSVKSV